MNINWIAELLDTVVSLTGKYGRWLNVKRNKTCFIIWFICTTYWMIRDIKLGLYSQSLFCLISLGMHVYGYFNWKAKEEKEK